MVTAKVTGLKELSKTFGALSFRQQRKRMTDLLVAAAEPIRARAEPHVPIGEKAPHIADHIITRGIRTVDDEAFEGRRRLEDHEFAAVIGPAKDWFYGKFLEHGTVKMRPQPFMRPGFDEGVADAQRILEHGIMPIVSAVVRSTGSRHL